MTLTPRKITAAIRGLGIAAGVAALIALTGPFRYSDLGLPFPDTVAHAGLFYALSALMFASLPKSRTFELMLVLLGLGALSEFAQAAIGREASLHDMAGDAAGVFAAILPTYLAHLRTLTRAHPDSTFEELRRMDRRQGRRSPAFNPPPEPTAAR